MQTKLEKVRAKIIEAVPEIVEFKFGCRIRQAGGVGTFYLTHRTAGCQPARRLWHTSPSLEHAFDEDNPLRMEVLGRPVTLADVLRAIHKADPPMTVNTAIEGEKDEEGTLALWYRMGDGEIIAVHIDLSLPFDEWEPEVVEFLAKILGV